MATKSATAFLALACSVAFSMTGALGDLGALGDPIVEMDRTAMILIPADRVDVVNGFNPARSFMHNVVKTVPPFFTDQGRPARISQESTGLGPQGMGDKTGILPYDGWYVLDQVINASANGIVSNADDPEDPANQNPAGSYLAWRFDPHSLARGPAFQIDSVSIVFNEISRGITIPRIMVCRDNGDPGSPGPDLADPLAEVSEFTVNIPSGDRAKSFDFSALSTPITDLSSPFYIVVNLPEGTMAGLPFDLGTLYNCPGPAWAPDPSTYHDWFSMRWGVYRSTEADPAWQRLGLWCDDSQSRSSLINCPMRLDISDYTDDATDDLYQFNQQSKYLFIRCAREGVFNPAKYTEASPCERPDWPMFQTDLSFVPFWAIPGVLGPYCPVVKIEAWNVDVYPNKDPGLDPDADENYTVLEARFTSNCPPEVPEPARWDGGGALAFPALNPDPQGPYDARDLPPLVERFTLGRWEACVSLLYADCDGNLVEPDEYPYDNMLDDAHLGCLPFFVRGVSDLDNFDPNSLRAVKGSDPNLDIRLVWDTIPRQDPRTYNIHIQEEDKTAIPYLFQQTDPFVKGLVGFLYWDLSWNGGPGAILYIEVYETGGGYELSKPDPLD